MTPAPRSLLIASLYLLATPTPTVDREESQVGKAEAVRIQSVATLRNTYMFLDEPSGKKDDGKDFCIILFEKLQSSRVVIH